MHQAEAALRQVSQPAVQQTARTAAGAESKIVLLDQPNPQPAHRGVSGDPGANNAAADDQNIEWLLFKELQGVPALHGWAA
jgi:hypothetical protein